ncbi:SDR family oxidoreductase [Streptomyces sp. NPDC001933]|uniref:SDR family oxidoreductase n=1 Tax=Streptomyces sp. NPDC001933 TaxID=3364626 RepID=UPI0036C37E15
MSSSIRVGERRKVAHQAAKSGLVWLTHHAASLTGRQGARCSLLSPGVTITASALATTTEKWRYEALASIRSPHLGWSEDMASMVALLFSNDDAFINVQSFLVDGGAHLSREPGSVTRCHLADFRFVLLSAATRRFHAVATPAGGGSWEPTPKKEPIR